MIHWHSTTRIPSRTRQPEWRDSETDLTRKDSDSVWVTGSSEPDSARSQTLTQSSRCHLELGAWQLRVDLLVSPELPVEVTLKFLARISSTSHLENIILWLLPATFFRNFNVIMYYPQTRRSLKSLQEWTSCLFYAILNHSWMFSNLKFLVALHEGGHKALYLTQV